MSTILLDLNETLRQSAWMATALDNGIDMLKVLVEGQWHHENLNNCLKNPRKAQEKRVVVFSPLKVKMLFCFWNRSFRSWDMCKFYRPCERFCVIDASELESLYFWEIFQFLWICWKLFKFLWKLEVNYTIFGEVSFRDKKYPKMPKNMKLFSKHDFSFLDTLRNRLSVNLILSIS